MAFPTMNALSVARLMTRGTVGTTSGIVESLPTLPHNIFSVPAVVDVSGMEFSVGALADASSGTPGFAAATNEASALQITFSDGGATGDATGRAVLFAATDMTNTVEFEARAPHDNTGTSATDLDADDWVNFWVRQQATSTAAMAQFDVEVSYVYGKPGAISSAT